MIRKQTEQINLRPGGRRVRNKGAILMLACFCMPVLVGLMGLAIDASVLYATKTKLQMACDGAALAGLRAMSLAQDTNSQNTMVQTVATQWFNANFSGNYLGTNGTALTTPTIGNANSTHTVTVSATTQAPSYFMKFWNRSATTIAASGTAGRRDVNLMMVLDRSGSMDSAGTNLSSSPCGQMRAAAKQFTGMFTPGRDSIGLVSFAETIAIPYSPNTDFQTQLGYSNSAGSGTGYIDNITCTGGTNTPTAISLAWNELYKKQLPGAYNVILLFTDGQPTAASFDLRTVMKSTSGCLDSTGVAIKNGGNMSTNPRNWTGRDANSGTTISLGTNTRFGPFNGPQAALYASGSTLAGADPMFLPSGTSASTLENVEKTTTSTGEAPGCNFGTPTNDFSGIPNTDLFGISITDTGYRSVTNTVSISNLVNVFFNLSDNAANFARNPVSGGNRINYTNGVQAAQTTFFVIGLGSNGGVDHTLLQKIANDPNGDPNNNTLWSPMTAVSGQPQGAYYYSPNTSALQEAFSKMGSSTLRLSQ